MEMVIEPEIYKQLKALLENNSEALVKLNDLRDEMKIIMNQVKGVKKTNLKDRITNELKNMEEISSNTAKSLAEELDKIQSYKEDITNLEAQKSELLEQLKLNLKSFEYIADIALIASEAPEYDITMKDILKYDKFSRTVTAGSDEIGTIDIPEFEEIPITNVGMTEEGLKCFYLTIVKYFRLKSQKKIAKKVNEKFPDAILKVFGNERWNGIKVKLGGPEVKEYLKKIQKAFEDTLSDYELFEIFMNQVDSLLRIDDLGNIQDNKDYILSIFKECSREWPEVLKEFENLQLKLKDPKKKTFFDNFVPKFRSLCKSIDTLQKQIQEICRLEKRIQEVDKDALDKEKNILSEIKLILGKFKYEKSPVSIKSNILNKLEIPEATKNLRVYLYALIFQIQGETRRDLKRFRKQLLEETKCKISEAITALKDSVEKGKISRSQDEWVFLEYLFLEKKSLEGFELPSEQLVEKKGRLRLIKGHQDGGQKGEIQTTLTSTAYFEKLKDESEKESLETFEILVNEGLWIDDISLTDHQDIGNSGIKGHRQRCKIGKDFKHVVKIYLDKGKGTYRRGIYLYSKDEKTGFIDLEYCGVVNGH